MTFFCNKVTFKCCFIFRFFGNTWIPQYSQKFLLLSPPKKQMISGHFVPKIPKKIQLSLSLNFLRRLVKSVPIPTLSPNLGDRNGDLLGLRTQLASQMYIFGKDISNYDFFSTLKILCFLMLHSQGHHILSLSGFLSSTRRA